MLLFSEMPATSRALCLAAFDTFLKSRGVSPPHFLSTMRAAHVSREREFTPPESIAQYLLGVRYLRYSGGRLSSVIDTAFIWDDTPEGHAFWSEIHDEWEKLCRSRGIA